MIVRLILLAVGLCAATLSSHAQIQFQRVYGGDSYDVGKEVIQTSDDGYLIVGSSGSFDEEMGNQVLLLKTDENGYLQWKRTYGKQFAERAESIQETTDGNLIIGGLTERIGLSYQAYVLKVTMEGDTIWSNHFGGEQWDFCNQVVALADGGAALFGQTFSYGAGDGDFYLIRLDSDGDTLWTRTYGGTALETGESIALTSDGGFVLAGTTESFGAGKKDMYVVRTNSDGDTLWTKTFGGPEDDICKSVATTADDGYVLAGSSYNHAPNPDKSVYTVIKSGGSNPWIKYDPYLGNNYWTNVLVEPGSGNVTVVGYNTEGLFGKEDARIVRYGGLDGIWNGLAKDHGSSLNDRFYDAKLTSDGGYIMLGSTEGFLNRFDDVYLVKGDDLGLSVNPELGVNEITIGENVFGVTIGPNPFSIESPTLFIQGYDEIIRKIKEPMTLCIFNAVGQIVLEQRVASGSTSIRGENLTQGIYSYQLTSGRTVLATGKAVSLR